MTGAVSALLAPWAKWAVDKRQKRLTHQYDLLADWRDGIADYSRRADFLPSQTWYQQLRPYLTSNGIAVVEDPRLPIMTDDEKRQRRQTVAVTLAKEIDRIERDWKLRK